MDKYDRYIFRGIGMIMAGLFILILIVRADHTHCVSEGMKQNRTAEEIVKICR